MTFRTNLIKNHLLPSSIAIIVGCLTLTGCSKEDRDAAMATANDTLKLDHEDVFSLKAGSCFDDVSSLSTDEYVSTIPMRECTEPHDNEAFYAFDLPDAPTYDDSEEIDQLQFDKCSAAFADYVGISYEDSKLDMSVFSPSNESWADGDREILCYLFEPNGEKLTTSMQGSQL